MLLDGQPWFDGLALSTLTFKWPWALVLLLGLPLMAWWWLRHERNRWESALQFSYTSALLLAQQMQARRGPWRRVVHQCMMLSALALLVIALARPVMSAQVLIHPLDMMVVMDVSISMLAEDIEPSRIEAAQKAGVRFVKSLPKDVRIGLILFAGQSALVAAPTQDHGQVERILANFQKQDLQQGTAIGDALRMGTQALSGSDFSTYDVPLMVGSVGDVPKADRPQRVMVLLSDGDQQAGYPWQQAAAEARAHNIAIHTVGIGSREGATITYEDREYYVSMNDLALRQIAITTGGQFYRVFSTDDFRDIYRQVTARSVDTEIREAPIGFIFAGGALLLLLLAFTVAREPGA